MDNNYNYLINKMFEVKDFELPNEGLVEQFRLFTQDSPNIFRENIDALTNYLKNISPQLMLSQFTIQYLLQRYNIVSNQVNVNKFELEFLQALLLKSSTIQTNECKEQNMIEIFYMLRLCELSYINMDDDISKDNADGLLSKIVQNDFFAVRNEYPQSFEIAREILRPLNHVIIEKTSLNIICFIDMIEKIEQMLTAKFFYSVECSTGMGININIFGVTLLDFIEKYNSSIEDSILKRYLELYSLKLGDLEDVDIDEIFSNNPVKKKFIINEHEIFFIYNIFRLRSNIFEMCRTIIESDDYLRKTFYGRTEFSLGHLFENYVNKIFALRFKDNKVFQGSLLRIDDKEYESDLLLIFENFAIVIECKAIAFNDNVKKGKTRQIKTIKRDLLKKSAIQSERFANHLLANLGKTIKLKKSGGGFNEIDLNKVTEVLRLSISLEPSNSLYTNKYLMFSENDNTNEEVYIPTISVYDLMVILDILKYDSEFIHYIYCRTYLEEINSQADELDYLSIYLETAFNTDKTLYNNKFKDKKNRLFYPTNSKIGNYLSGIDEKPSAKRTALWNGMIDQIERNRKVGWLDKALSLLDIPHIVQLQIERDIIPDEEMILTGENKGVPMVIYSKLITNTNQDFNKVKDTEKLHIELLMKSNNFSKVLIILFWGSKEGFYIDNITI